MTRVEKIKFHIAQILVIFGHMFLDMGNTLSVDAFEENFDGSRPFGKQRKLRLESEIREG